MGVRLIWFLIKHCHVLNGKTEAILLWVLISLGRTPGLCLLFDQIQGTSITPVFSTGSCGPMKEDATIVLSKGPVLILIELIESLVFHANKLGLRSMGSNSKAFTLSKLCKGKGCLCKAGSETKNEQCSSRPPLGWF